MKDHSDDRASGQPCDVSNVQIIACDCVTPKKLQFARDQYDADRKRAHELQVRADTLRSAGGDAFHKAQAEYEKAALEELESLDRYARLREMMDADTLARIRSLVESETGRIQLGGLLLETPQVGELREEAVKTIQRLDDLDSEVAYLKLSRTAERKAVRA